MHNTPITVFIVDDDEGAVARYKKFFLIEYPEAKVLSAESLYEAATSSEKIDLLLVDISSITNHTFSTSAGYSALGSFHAKKNGTVIWVHSGCSNGTGSEFVAEVTETLNGMGEFPEIRWIGWLHDLRLFFKTLKSRF